MGWWRDNGLPRCVDKALSTGPVMRLRAQVCAGLGGRVLEIGFGSGLNVGAYPGAVTSVDVVEPAEGAWALSSGRRRASAVPIARIGLDGERLTAPSESYDAVLSTFTLRPGGRFHLLEHGLASSGSSAAAT